MESAKHKVDTAVTEYIRLFPDEYQAFAEWSEGVRTEQTRLGKIGKADGLVERKLGEIPEHLYTAIVKLLTQTELAWFKADGEFRGDFKGPYWFYKKYPVFAITTI